jgi:hypothetical protein
MISRFTDQLKDFSQLSTHAPNIAAKSQQQNKANLTFQIDMNCLEVERWTTWDKHVDRRRFQSHTHHPTTIKSSNKLYSLFHRL